MMKAFQSDNVNSEEPLIMDYEEIHSFPLCKSSTISRRV